MVDGETAVHHERDTCSCGACLGSGIGDALLQPNQARQGTQRECFIDHRARQLTAAEDVHDIECQIARGRTECRIAPLTENGLVSRIHGHDAIARQL